MSYKKKNISISYYQSFSRVMLLFLGLYTGSFLFSQNTILNGSFEDGVDSLATNWAIDPLGSGRSTNYALSGNYSMSVWNWYYYIEGIAANGTINSSFGIFDAVRNGGTPFVYKPAFVEGHYLYDTTGTVSNNDSAIVEVFLKKYNLTTSTIDTVAHGEKHLPATDLSQGFVDFSVPINDLMPGITPDSIVIILRSSINGFCNSSGSGNCLYFYVDELNAIFPLGNKTPILTEKANLWPNPMIDVLNINIPNGESAKIKLLNINGQLIKKQTIRNNEPINVQDLQPGVYLLSIEHENRKELHKIIK